MTRMRLLAISQYHLMLQKSKTGNAFEMLRIIMWYLRSPRAYQRHPYSNTENTLLGRHRIKPLPTLTVVPKIILPFLLLLYRTLYPLCSCHRGFNSAWTSPSYPIPMQLHSVDLLPIHSNWKGEEDLVLLLYLTHFITQPYPHIFPVLFY